MSAVVNHINTQDALTCSLPAEYAYVRESTVDRRITSLVSVLFLVGIFTERKEPLLLAAALLFVSVSKPPPLQFPTEEQMSHLSDEKLRAIWMRNTATLIGMLATHTFRPFGFHGTSERGMKGICRDKMSKGIFYVAGIEGYHHPVSYLADLYTIASKALGYMSNGGGLFLIATDGGEKYGFGIKKYIWSNTHISIYLAEPKNDQRFLKLIYRGRSENQPLLFSSTGTQIPIMEVNFADEMNIPLTNDNFSERVLGLLHPEQLGWNAPPLHYRFVMQKIIATALLHLSKGADLNLKAAHKRGVALLEQVEDWSAVTVSKLGYFGAWDGTDQPLPGSVSISNFLG